MKNSTALPNNIDYEAARGALDNPEWPWPKGFTSRIIWDLSIGERDALWATVMNATDLEDRCLEYERAAQQARREAQKRSAPGTTARWWHERQVRRGYAKPEDAPTLPADMERDELHHYNAADTVPQAVRPATDGGASTLT